MIEPQSVSNGAPAASLGDVVVTAVNTPAEKKEFIALQYELYKNDPNFVPPLLMERNDFLNEKKNPWFEFGRAQLFLARRHGKVVGRISASEDPRYNDFHGTQIGWFGLFECIDDQAVANALLDTAERWVKARGLKQFLWPCSFSSNQDWGTLIEGFDQPPVLMTPYNARYYPKLFEAWGLSKAKDLWAWQIDIQKDVPEKVARIAEKVRKREEIIVRQANMKDWDAEVRRIKNIYNDAWEKNWGFVPMTEREFDHLAKDLKQILIPELCLIAEVNYEAVGFAITLPDANIALKATGNGRLTTFGLPIGLAKLLLASKKIKSGRLAILGIKAGYRKRGLDSVLFLDTFNNCRKQGWWGGEISWTLEDNDMVNRAIEIFGCKRYKTYRVYEKTENGQARGTGETAQA
jgi:GNAT superfamily N-acetyltransferase